MQAISSSAMRELLLSQINLREFSIDQLAGVVKRPSCYDESDPRCVNCDNFYDILNKIVQISMVTGISSSELQKRFGTFLLHKLLESTPNLYREFVDSFELLEGLEEHARLEFKYCRGKSIFPQFECVKESKRLTLMCRSPWPLAAIVEGVIEACIG